MNSTGGAEKPEFSDKLGSYLANTKLMKKAFAKETGVTPSTVTFWLDGTNKPDELKLKSYPIKKSG